MASPVSRVLLAPLALLVNKAPPEHLALLVPVDPLALLELLAKMDSTASQAPSAPLVPVVALVTPALLVPPALLDPPVLLVPPAADSTSSCPSHLKRRLRMVAATTGQMTPTWSVTVTSRWTPPSRA